MLRAPISLYRAKLGWVMGKRFLCLHHTGAKTGLPRHTALEVVKYDPENQTWTLAVGFGPKSHWYQNLRKTPEAEIEFGLRRVAVRARFPDEDEGGEIMVDYAHRHPKAAQTLMGFCGYEVDGSDADYREVAHLGLLFVVLETRDPSAG